MFTLHHFHNLRAAQAFSDYLNAIDIKNKIQDDDFIYQLLIEQDTQQTRAEKELAFFLHNPNDSKYLSASWQTGKTDQNNTQLAYRDSHLISNFINHGGMISHGIFTICVLVYALISLNLLNPMQSLLAFFNSPPFDYSQGWRFITPVFLHFSLLHIAFNLLWWWELGGLVEKQQGKLRLLLLFFLTAITSNLAQYYLVGPYFGGLSGVVYGLVGYCWLSGILNKNSRVNLPNSYFLFLLLWLILGFINILPVNVANYAHLIGLLTGLIFAAISSLGEGGKQN